MKYLVAVRNGESAELKLVNGIKELFESVFKPGYDYGGIRRVYADPDGGIHEDKVSALGDTTHSLTLVGYSGVIVDSYHEPEPEKKMYRYRYVETWETSGTFESTTQEAAEAQLEQMAESGQIMATSGALTDVYYECWKEKGE